MNTSHQGFREVLTRRGPLFGLLVKENPFTVWVKLPDGNVIKRHKVKHRVKE